MRMMEMLSGFAALCLLSGALTELLPDGSIRRTAKMCIGMLMLLYWTQGLPALLERLPAPLSAPPSALSSTGISVSDLERALAEGAAP